MRNTIRRGWEPLEWLLSQLLFNASVWNAARSGLSRMLFCRHALGVREFAWDLLRSIFFPRCGPREIEKNLHSSRWAPIGLPSRDPRSGAQRDKKGDLLSFAWGAPPNPGCLFHRFKKRWCTIFEWHLKLLQTRVLPGAFMQRWKKLKSFGGSGEVDLRPQVWMCRARNKRRRAPISTAAKLQSNPLITILGI